MRNLNKRGFTIIELLIATVIFSLILLIVTGAVVQFSRIYYKGVISARTQESTRNIMNDISTAIQFSGGTNVTYVAPAPPAPGYLCVGAKRYTFRYGIQATTTQHVVIADKVTTGCASGLPSMTTAIPAGSNLSELAGDNMQLINLSVNNIAGTGLYKVSVRLGYGQTADMVDNEPVVPDGKMDACKAIVIGGQFCAVIDLSTTVAKRIE